MIPQIVLLALAASMASAQTLTIPTRSGNVVSLPRPSTITGAVDMGNKEFDRGRPCNTDADTGNENAVFILANGASLSNVIIGANALEGIHCQGSCTLRNVWFRDVCEDAISIIGRGNAVITGGGASGAQDKIIQHNNVGTVTIRGFTAVNSGKLYRSCGDCTDNSSKSPRHVVVENVRVNGITTDLVGINSNFGDTATISGSCGSVKGRVCQEWTGVNKGNGKSTKRDRDASCLGAQGKMIQLPAC
ncbi:hypothetical protein LEMA_P092160.1 [Plenodomus lingam JN3]|uniref:Pectate lyase n=1 Tax=Leptosphaeria maculans (strain JN3 / isolate v23.1.3 / race Av1-4-5-6-7-8) TaxID=985895 RepID=E5A2L1_LEPMJ|nr:hypothetical protein LEMA_P092160.1 [Plenodomus lingam JN3]CBX97807.1 hypothetical protein LEMA_P092160.1 [Plenodomus lingam JN3]